MAYQKLAEIDQISEGKIYSFSKRYYDIAVVRKKDEYFAFEDICSHDGGSISDGEIEGNKVICPRHFAAFDIKTGEVLCMPATEGIKIFPTRIIDGSLEVELEDE